MKRPISPLSNTRSRIKRIRIRILGNLMDSDQHGTVNADSDPDSKKLPNMFLKSAENMKNKKTKKNYCTECLNWNYQIKYLL